MYYRLELTMHYRLEIYWQQVRTDYVLWLGLTMYYYCMWYDKLWGPSQRVVTLFYWCVFWDTLYLVYLEVERLVLGPGRKTKARLPASSKTGKCLGNIGRHLVHFCQRGKSFCSLVFYLKIVPGEVTSQTVFPLRSDQWRSWEEITKKYLFWVSCWWILVHLNSPPGKVRQKTASRPSKQFKASPII